MLFLRLYQIFLIHSLLFPLYAAAFDHHLYERLPYSQPFYLQAGQPVYLYQVPYHHDNRQVPISRLMKGLLAFTEVQPELSTLTFISRQPLPTRRGVLPGLVMITELMFSPLDLVDVQTAQFPEETWISKLPIFIGPPEEPPRC
jgi:hypothetical protein